MSTINSTEFHRQVEQLAELGWACSVLAGLGEPDDCPDVATGMIETLAVHGTDLVRRAAAGALGAGKMSMM